MKLAWLHILIIRSACKVALSVPQCGWRHLSGWFLPGVGLVAACCLLQISCSRNPNTNSAPNKTTKEAEAGNTRYVKIDGTQSVDLVSQQLAAILG